MFETDINACIINKKVISPSRLKLFKPLDIVAIFRAK